MNFQGLIDFAEEAHDEIGKYRLDNIVLSPAKMRFNAFCVPALVWQSIPYGDAEIDQVPDDKPGLYAFALCEQSAILPPHGYVLYIGITGKKPGRTLRQRYREYLNEKIVKKRSRIAFMIGNWHEVLRFYYVSVETTFPVDDLEKLEKQLNTALMPPFSVGDLEAETKRKRRAFT